eukprot:1765428-Ditylum_brightwellii.AAC.1
MRQSLLNQAKLYVPSKIDLVVLRRVVRIMLHDDDDDEEEQKEEDEEVRIGVVSMEEKKDAVRALRNVIVSNIRNGVVAGGITRKNKDDEDDDEVEQEEQEKRWKKALSKVLPSDARKMGSIHWLCYNSHYAGDALLCANMLLRQFMLEMEEEETEEEEGGGEEAKSNIKHAREKMHSAK